MKIVVIGAGISGLATGYRLTERAEKLGVPLDLHVLEAEDRVGGTMSSIQTSDGFIIETGPNGVLDNKPDTLALARDLGIGNRLVSGSDSANRRWVVLNGRLELLPTSPGTFLRSRLLSPLAKLRIAMEPWIPRRRSLADESVAAFARRRLGPRALERLIDPFVSGVFAGDPERLSVRSAFPRLVELESQYGSLIRASRALAKARRALPAAGATGGSSPSAGPAGKLWSFEGGMRDLPMALEAALGSAVRTGERVIDVRRAQDGWVVSTDSGLRLSGVDAVVLTIPAFAAARLLAPLSEGLSRPLEAIEYAPVSVVALGFRREDVSHPLDGFGFLVPSRERRPILGCLIDSSVYPGRAPKDHVLLRSIVGGSRRPEDALRPDGELIELVLKELDPHFGIEGRPVVAEVIRWRNAIPQYTLGHSDRVNQVESASREWPGLWVAGNALRGVAVNDCTREASRLAEALIPAPG
ncbi:MAG: protoporphyrinogen oxidase [Myxococcales bacterium]|nr:protoporphyrinogen oxidase [Myxococcales bacterium]